VWEEATNLFGVSLLGEEDRTVVEVLKSDSESVFDLLVVSYVESLT